MTESFLTTDIIVIIVLFIVLGLLSYSSMKTNSHVHIVLVVIIGICAFATHFYWTKIGVSEIWNTVKWSSMRSSFYRTMHRFSRTSNNKFDAERPFSPASIFSEDSDGSALPAPLRKKNPEILTTYTEIVQTNVRPPNNHMNQVSTESQNHRQNSSNCVQPVTTISYNNSVKVNRRTNQASALDDTQFHQTHGNNDGTSVSIQTRR
jgi:hypothetical protein